MKKCEIEETQKVTKDKLPTTVRFALAATIEKIKEDIEEDYEQLRNQLEML